MKLPEFKLKNLHYLLPFLVLILIFIAPVFLVEHRAGINWTHVFRIWKENSIIVLLFLFNRFFLLPKLFFHGKKIVYLLSLSCIIFLISLIFYINFSLFMPEQISSIQPPIHLKISRAQPPHPPKGQVPPYINFFIMSILILGFDTGLIFYTKWMDAEKKKIQIEKENIENKMAFLQNQISPHFFMNTLNNIHALVDIDAEEAKKAIIMLSRLMDYLLYESKSTKIPIQKEINFIKSYIELMRLRFTKDIDIKLDLPLSLPSIKLPPLLSVSFIENAFKHGISYQKPSFVHIKLTIDKNRLYFIIKNSVHFQSVSSKNSGIGLVNVRNRLDLIYGENYNLFFHKDDSVFIVKLEIPI